jgi:hypothetical protein
MSTPKATIDQIRESATAAFDLEQPMHRDEAIFRAIADVLAEAGHFALPEWAPLSLKIGRKTARAHGYEHDEDMGILTIFHQIDCHEARDLHQVWDRVLCPSGDIERAVSELESIVNVARDNKLPDLDTANPASDMCRLLQRFADKSENRICLCIWTTGELSKEGWKRSDKSPFHTEVWDASRLISILDSGHEPLTVDFRSHGGGIDCLLDDSDFEKLSATGGAVMLGKIPGECLADIYFVHRTRLLQQNVRAFLNFAGSVNKGIRDTIKTEPERFLSYNNGIAVTASGVDLERVAPGVYRLLCARDFQIVNGGQTTAALMHTRLDNQSDLKPIQVAMKLTVVRPEDLDSLVPKISLYANSQNKVQEADFASNNPWLVKLEDISRKIEASKDEKSAGQPIHWYFERVRGQYNVDLTKLQGAQRNAFKAKRPPRSKFGKTDLATAAMSWEAEPQVVSLGRQKCFGYFIRKLTGAKDMAHKGTTVEPSEEDFRRLCCLLILRREAIAACKELEIAAYRANVIAYAMALISARTKTKLPFADIWAAQALPPAVSKALRIALRGCDKVIREEAATRRQNVTEFAKKDDCWAAVLAASIQLEMGTGGGKWDGFSVADTVRSPEMIEATELFFEFSEAEWEKISKAIGELINNPVYPGVALTMAKNTVIRKKPSDKQARILAKGLLKLREQDLVQAILKKILPDDWQVLEQLAA